MINKNIIQTIKDKEMDRKDFLKYSGIAVLGLIGLRGVASLLTSANHHQANNASTKPATSGFGGGKYGV